MPTKTKPKKSARDLKIMEIARQNENLHEGELELDDNAVISEGDDNGAYVQVWMWVPFDGTPLDKEPEES